MTIRRHVAALLAATLLMAAMALPVSAGPLRVRVIPSPSNVNLGNVAVGSDSGRVILWVTNESNIRLFVQYLNYDSESLDSILADQAALSHVFSQCLGSDLYIEPGETCALAVVYMRPTTVGVHTLKFTAGFNDGLSVVTTTTITVKGRGI